LTYYGDVVPSVRRAQTGAGLPPAHDPQALSWLLRRAVRRYATPVADALEAGGFGDLPQRGVWALSALAQTEPGLSGRDLVTRMGISKQAVSQLVDTLVTMGYVARRPAPDDRRRTLLHLTTRGRSAARIIEGTVAGLEADMACTIGGAQLLLLHRALVELDEAGPTA
jgi:DNA-binding MarR family transcriptional regulator